MASNTSNRIFISRTSREWKEIEQRLKEKGRKDLNAYIRGKIYLLQKQYEQSPDSVCAIPNRIQKPYILTDDSYRMLSLISVRTGIPISTIVDRLIVEPLLFPPKP